MKSYILIVLGGLIMELGFSESPTSQVLQSRTPAAASAAAASAPGSASAPLPVCKTDKGESCHFPFVYNDVSYNDCTSVDTTRAWCATAPTYSADTWGYCGPSCVSKADWIKAVEDALRKKEQQFQWLAGSLEGTVGLTIWGGMFTASVVNFIFHTRCCLSCFTCGGCQVGSFEDVTQTTLRHVLWDMKFNLVYETLLEGFDLCMDQVNFGQLFDIIRFDEYVPVYDLTWDCPTCWNELTDDPADWEPRMLDTPMKVVYRGQVREIVEIMENEWASLDNILFDQPHTMLEGMEYKTSDFDDGRILQPFDVTVTGTYTNGTARAEVLSAIWERNNGKVLELVGGSIKSVRLDNGWLRQLSYLFIGISYFQYCVWILRWMWTFKMYKHVSNQGHLKVSLCNILAVGVCEDIMSMAFLTYFQHTAYREEWNAPLVFGVGFSGLMLCFRFALPPFYSPTVYGRCTYDYCFICCCPENGCRWSCCGSENEMQGDSQAGADSEAGADGEAGTDSEATTESSDDEVEGICPKHMFAAYFYKPHHETDMYNFRNRHRGLPNFDSNKRKTSGTPTCRTATSTEAGNTKERVVELN